MLYTYINYQSTFYCLQSNITYWKGFEASCLENKSFLPKTEKIIFLKIYVSTSSRTSKVGTYCRMCIDLQMTEL